MTDPVEVIARSQRSEGEYDDPLETWEITLAQAALTALQEAGFAVVPVEPSKEIISTALDAIYSELKDSYSFEELLPFYRAMIAASKGEE